MNKVRKKIFLLLLISISAILFGADEKNNGKISFSTSNNPEGSIFLTKNVGIVKNTGDTEIFQSTSLSAPTREFIKNSREQKFLAESFIDKLALKTTEKNDESEEFNDIRVVKDIKEKISKTGKCKKAIFIQSLLPIIGEIHEDIFNEKERLDKIAKYGIKTSDDRDFLDELFTKYKVSDENINELQSKLIIIPKSLVLGQASLESGWGGSLLALDANNLFGMKSWARDSRSYRVGPNTYYKKYNTIKDSIYDYMLTLSRHGAYENFREAITDENNNSLQLVKYLNNYSELKSEYGRKVSVIIRVNNLLEYDS